MIKILKIYSDHSSETYLNLFSELQPSLTKWETQQQCVLNAFLGDHDKYLRISQTAEKGKCLLTSHLMKLECIAFTCLKAAAIHSALW